MMNSRARVTSVEALEAFRARLVVYAAQARAALEEVSAEVLHTRDWIESDRRTWWENQVRRRARALEEARQALFGARLSTLKTECSAEQLLVHRAKQSLEEAEAKLRLVKSWCRDFDNRVQPLLKQTEKLHSVLSQDLTLAAAFLAQAVSTLTDYAQGRPPAGITAPSASPAAESPPQGADAKGGAS
ncbi:MAG TPA: hypothetical protein P5038_16805 [Candidatus Paceibacterota bacterium]|jgi:chromosome segregation ATPase|nr:hypothetical protein [Candidatus Paceibacterota bacterium]